jgi:anthranilate synthase component 2
MSTLIIDNYDSFTYNLVQYFQCLGEEVQVYTHDNIDVQGIIEHDPDRLVISPGPKAPDDAGISLEVVRYFYDKKPLLGVCLGHQCIAQAFGGNIIAADEIMHGKTSRILHHKQKLFKDLPQYFLATRYHSLTVDIPTLPSCFSIDAWAGKTIMALSHRHYPVYGVQFHPEAILTEYGIELLKQFCKTRSVDVLP